jgi:hypothetical protein
VLQNRFRSPSRISRRFQALKSRQAGADAHLTGQGAGGCSDAPAFSSCATALNANVSMPKAAGPTRLTLIGNMPCLS